MSSTQQVLNRITLVAGEAITAGRIVALDGTHTINKGVGVAERAADTGEAIPVIVQGICHVTSGAAVLAGALVTADADGKAVTAVPNTTAAGTNVDIVGVAIDAATDANQTIRIWVTGVAVPGTYDAAEHAAEKVISIVSTENLTANCIVDAEGKHTANKGVGVAQASVTSGAAASVKIIGTCNVVSGAAFAIGDYLTADSNGKAVKYDPANVNIGTVIGIVGIALAAATAADQTKSILLCPCVAVGTKAVG